jgi:hypothetical protein
MGTGFFSRIRRAKRVLNDIKNNPIKLKQRKMMGKKYYQKNREKKLAHHRELRKFARENGFCNNCLNKKESKKYASCLKCREKMRVYSKNYYQRRKENEKTN